MILGAAAQLAAVAVTITRAASDEEFVGPLSGWRNVKTHYGAVDNGVADDTAALQTALNELRVARKNGWSVLYFQRAPTASPRR